MSKHHWRSINWKSKDEFVNGERQCLHNWSSGYRFQTGDETRKYCATLVLEHHPNSGVWLAECRDRKPIRVTEYQINYPDE